MASRRLEIEVKLPVADPNEIRRRLMAAGFRCSQRRALEVNEVWDTKGGALRKKGILLRLRRTGRGKPVMTLKGPRRPDKGFRVRPELDLIMKSAAAPAWLLKQLGYRVVFRYEKYRAIYSRRKDRGAGVICVDETPIGNYLELEGTKSWVRRTTRELGFRFDETITKSYAALFSRWRRRTGSRRKNMLFA